MQSFTCRLSRQLGILAVLVSVGLSSASASTAVNAARLGADLTPFGAEKAGNKDGSIPAWTGGLSEAPPGWKAGHVDPFKEDKPLFSIDASNIDQYKDRLPEGQIALINAYKGYRMDVYPTRRSCTFPDFVAERTKKNVAVAKIAADGWGLDEAVGGAIPFPMPQSGIEAMYNFKLRYLGEGRRADYSLLIPDKSGYTEIKQQATELYALNSPEVNSLNDTGKGESKLFYEVLSPSSRAGEMYLMHTFVDKPLSAWIYFPGQRRVRLAPSFAYDNPVAGTDNLYFVDQFNMYTGAFDRYDYELIGKKEIYVPYNTYKLIDKNNKYKDMLQPDFLTRDVMRYELHRVWVVEASVKSDKRHTYAKRTFYIDEDSWAILHVDMYDAQGKLWRTQEGSLWMAPEVQSCVAFEYQLYDLVAHRYLIDNYTAESDVLDLTAAKEGRIKSSLFTASELRRRGER